MTKNLFSTFDAARLLGVPYQTLRSWLDSGFIAASGAQAHGRGTRTLFTRKDLYLMRLFSYLTGRGFSREVAERLVLPFRAENEFTSDLIRNTGIIGIYVDTTDSPLTMYYPEGDEKIELSIKGHTPDGKKGEFEYVLLVNWKRLRVEVDRKILN